MEGDSEENFDDEDDDDDGDETEAVDLLTRQSSVEQRTAGVMLGMSVAEDAY